jgi:WD40 repeat protein
MAMARHRREIVLHLRPHLPSRPHCSWPRTMMMGPQLHMSGESGAHLQTLTGHTDVLRALAIAGSNGKIYSGSYDKTIRVWSSASGAHMQTLTGVQ